MGFLSRDLVALSGARRPSPHLSLRPTCVHSACGPAPVAPPAAERLRRSELHPDPKAFCALPLPIRPTLSHSGSVASACVSFPVSGAPLASPRFLNLLPIWFITFVESLDGRYRFKTPAQQAVLGIEHHSRSRYSCTSALGHPLWSSLFSDSHTLWPGTDTK